MKTVKIIGEIGINHNRDIDIAKQLIDIASYAGFDYVKFQKREPDRCVPDEQKKQIRDTPWGMMNYIDYRKKIEFDQCDYEYIDNYCRKRGIGWFASAWDMQSAMFLANFSTDLIKIPSPVITNLDVLKFCRENFKIVIISTGMSTQEEIDTAVGIAKPDIIMHSVSIYPTPVKDLNFNYIVSLIKKYPEKEIGYSGHEIGIDFIPYIVGLGVTWIEKHITISKNLWGSDQQISIEPEEMFKMTRIIRNIQLGIGRMEDRYLLANEEEIKQKLRKV